MTRCSGFTVVRNGTRFDYPFLESLNSLSSLVDEVVINVGDGEDDTLERVRAWAETVRRERGERAPEIVIFESAWRLEDPERRRGGQILAEQTNLALERCSHDWCLYLQADEVLHERDAANLRQALAEAALDPRVEGLVFEYTHFYGSFDVVQVSRSAYRREVRAVRKSTGVRSVGDAQSFRAAEGRKLRVTSARSWVYHYGWVRRPEAMRSKTEFMDTLYHAQPGATGDNYRYKRFWGLRRFTGTHPAVMRERIAARAWDWELERSPWEWRVGDLPKIALDLIERVSGLRLFEYRSYEWLPGAEPRGGR